jgi:hypothetical protein
MRWMLDGLKSVELACPGRKALQKRGRPEVGAARWYRVMGGLSGNEACWARIEAAPYILSLIFRAI